MILRCFLLQWLMPLSRARKESMSGLQSGSVFEVKKPGTSRTRILVASLEMSWQEKEVAGSPPSLSA